MAQLVTRGASPAELPKEEIEASAYLREHPDWDGRGVVVGVLDTGVDPGAPGLQTTPDGRPKIVDLVDCTGSGDVDTSATAEPCPEGTLKGLSGRTLRLPDGWPKRKEGAKFHLGVKVAFELYPRGLAGRVREERRKRYNEAHARAVAEAQAGVAALGGGAKEEDAVKNTGEAKQTLEDEQAADDGKDKDKASEQATAKKALEDEQGADDGKDKDKASEQATAKEALEDEQGADDGKGKGKDKASEQGTAKDGRGQRVKAADEVRARPAVLAKLDKALEDVGPVYDVVAFEDDKGTWRVCLDTSEAGDLAKCRLLSPFRLRQEWSTLDDESALNYSVDVFDAGRRVNVCVDSGAHGTHVAGIIGAHFPDRPALNGIAPGCQIIGFKIGDTRLGSMETGTSLCRALAAAVERGCRLLNLSFGEYASVDNYGRFTQLLEKAVHKHGLVLVTSAGNNGPALSTCGAPGCSDHAIAVGAFASTAMMAPQYSLRAPLPDIQYTWSSRGPNVDGDLGVAISAPGAAIAPVPNWTLQGRQLMNGTSMASPNACGGVALLLSAIAARGESWTPVAVRRAIENTAAQAANATGGAVERWALGCGLLQVRAASAWLESHGAKPLASCRFRVRADVHGAGTAAACPASHLAHGLACGGRGIYLREPQHALAREAVAEVYITPQLPEGLPPAAKVALDVSVSLRSSAPWVSCAPSLALTHGGKGFQVKVALAQLPPGAHVAEVTGIGACVGTGPDMGPLFRVPITVCKPHADLRAPSAGCRVRFDAIAFHPGHIERRFIVPPEGATWCTIVLRARAGPRADGGAAPRLLVLHTAQVLPQTSVGRSEAVARVNMAAPPADSGLPPAEFAKTVAVTGGVTLEVAVAQWWSALGDLEVDVSVEFRGLVPACDHLWLDGRELFTPQAVHAPFRREAVEPGGKLTTLRRAVRPSSVRAVPPVPPVAGGAGVGDEWPDGSRTFDYQVVYKFSLKEPADAVTVRFPSLCCHLYESPYEAQLWALFDGNKRVIRIGDYYAEAAKVPSGDSQLRLIVRHDSLAFLERLKDMPAVLEMKLASPVAVDFAHSRAAALGDPALATAKPPLRLPLEAGSRAQLFAVSPVAPDIAEPGDVLTGTVTYANTGNELEGAGKRPQGWPVSMVVVAPPNKDLLTDATKPKPAAGDSDDNTSPARLAEAVRDLRIQQLGKLGAKCKGDDAATSEARSRYDTLLRDLRAEMAAEEPPAGQLALLSGHAAHLAKLAGAEDVNAQADVVAACNEAAACVDGKDLAAKFGVTVDPDDREATREREKAEADKKTFVSVLVTKATALGNIYTAASTNGNADSAAAARTTLDETMAELFKWAPAVDHPKAVAQWHSSHARHALAAQALEEQLAKAKSAPPRVDVEALLPPLRALGWDHLVRLVEARLLRDFPPNHPLPFADESSRA